MRRILEKLEALCEAWLKALREVQSQRSACSTAELQRLRGIEHYAWHLIDDSEEDAQTGEVTIKPMREDYDALSKLLPENHP